MLESFLKILNNWEVRLLKSIKRTLNFYLSETTCCRVLRMAQSGCGASKHLRVWWGTKATTTQCGTPTFPPTGTISSPGDMTELPGKKRSFCITHTVNTQQSCLQMTLFHVSSNSLWATDHYQPLRMFSGHLADVTCTRFHPNSNYVATGSSDRTIRLWDVLSGNCVRIFTGHKVRRVTRAVPWSDSSRAMSWEPNQLSKAEVINLFFCQRSFTR